MSPELPVVEVRGLTKGYPGVIAAEAVDMAFHAGEIVGLVGKNGAGKSTVIKLLAGAVMPDAGEVRVDGERVELRSPHDARALGLSFLHQEQADVPGLSVAENIELGLGYPRRLRFLVDWRELNDRSARILSRLESDLDPRTPVASLSVAEQRLVTIARAIAQRAKLLVLDEPTASLTDTEIEHLHSVLRSLRGEGVAVVYVSHRLDEILALTDRIVVMRDGHVVGAAPTAQISRRTLIMDITGRKTPHTAGDRRTERGIRGRPETPELLRVEGLSTHARLEGVGFDLRQGEILGVAGLVGAGRTELVRAVFGADRRSSGRILIGGREVRIDSPRDALAAGLVLLPEDRRTQGLIADFGICDNITLAALSRHRRTARLPIPSRRHERAATRELMDRLSISSPDVDKPVRLLSGGNQQKVVLAKWLHRGADVLIFDEPTHGVDVETKEEVYRLMEQLAARGRGVIFISSEFSELVAVCHRALVLRDGRTAGELEGDELTEEAMIDRCYRAADAPVAPATAR